MPYLTVAGRIHVHRQAAQAQQQQHTVRKERELTRFKEYRDSGGSVKRRYSDERFRVPRSWFLVREFSVPVLRS